MFPRARLAKHQTSLQQWRRQAFQTGGALHSMEDSRGGHAKKQATKKRYHFITLGVQQSRSELLRTGGMSAVGGARTC